MLDIEHGILLGLFGISITLIGFFIAFSVANYYYKKEQKIKNAPPNPVYDLFKDWPGKRR